MPGFTVCVCVCFFRGVAVPGWARCVPGEGGRWIPAKVLRIWDQGRPYRLALTTEGDKNIWVPVDSEGFIKAASASAAAVEISLEKEGETKAEA